jgi:hypothetical protein
MADSTQATKLNLIKENKKKESSTVSALSPREIVSELDRYVIGQTNAKKAVAVALRNRWRRQALDEQMREEVLPKNILMIGPTGVGKTEISRRLSKLDEAPFIKVEVAGATAKILINPAMSLIFTGWLFVLVFFGFKSVPLLKPLNTVSKLITSFVILNCFLLLLYIVTYFFTFLLYSLQRAAFFLLI